MNEFETCRARTKHVERLEAITEMRVSMGPDITEHGLVEYHVDERERRAPVQSTRFFSRAIFSLVWLAAPMLSAPT